MLTESISRCLRWQNSKETSKDNREAVAQQKELIKELLKEEEIEKRIIKESIEKVKEADSKNFTISVEKFQEIEKKRNVVEGIRGLYPKELQELKASLYRFQDLLYIEDIMEKESKHEENKNILLQQANELDKINETAKNILSQEKALNDYLNIVKYLKYDKEKLKQLKTLAIISSKSPLLSILSLNIFNKEWPKFSINPVGLSNIPDRGPCIIAAHHHHSILDPFILKAIVDRSIFFIAATETFILWAPAGRFARDAGMIPYTKDDTGKVRITPKFIKRRIDKYNNDNNKSMMEVFKHLRVGDIIGIFPEGDSKTFFPTYKRPKDQEFLSPNSGYVLLSTIMKIRYDIDVPIIPIGLNYEGISIRVMVGKPVHITEDVKGMDDEQLKTFIEEESERIFEEIKRLSD